MNAPQDDLASVVAVIAEASVDGSPVAPSGDEERRDVAAVAVRRWNTFERRAKKASGALDARVEYLAKGLRDAYEPDSARVGPLMTDYRWLAQRIALALTSRA